MELDLKHIEKQARAAEVRGEGVTRRTLKGFDVEDLEDKQAEEDARHGEVEKSLGRED